MQAAKFQSMMDWAAKCRRGDVHDNLCVTPCTQQDFQHPCFRKINDTAKDQPIKYARWLMMPSPYTCLPKATGRYEAHNTLLEGVCGIKMSSQQTGFLRNLRKLGHSMTSPPQHDPQAYHATLTNAPPASEHGGLATTLHDQTKYDNVLEHVKSSTKEAAPKLLQQTKKHVAALEQFNRALTPHVPNNGSPTGVIEFGLEHAPTGAQLQNARTPSQRAIKVARGVRNPPAHHSIRHLEEHPDLVRVLAKFQHGMTLSSKEAEIMMLHVADLPPDLRNELQAIIKEAYGPAAEEHLNKIKFLHSVATQHATLHSLPSDAPWTRRPGDKGLVSYDRVPQRLRRSAFGVPHDSEAQENAEHVVETHDADVSPAPASTDDVRESFSHHASLVMP